MKTDNKTTIIAICAAVALTAGYSNQQAYQATGDMPTIPDWLVMAGPIIAGVLAWMQKNGVGDSKTIGILQAMATLLTAMPSLSGIWQKMQSAGLPDRAYMSFGWGDEPDRVATWGQAEPPVTEEGG